MRDRGTPSFPVAEGVSERDIERQRNSQFSCSGGGIRERRREGDIQEERDLYIYIYIERERERREINESSLSLQIVKFFNNFWEIRPEPSRKYSYAKRERERGSGRGGMVRAIRWLPLSL